MEIIHPKVDVQPELWALSGPLYLDLGMCILSSLTQCMWRPFELLFPQESSCSTLFFPDFWVSVPLSLLAVSSRGCRLYIYIFKYFQQLSGKLLCLKSMEQKGQKQRPVSMEYYSDIKKEWKNPICSNSMDCHTEWNKSDKDISLWNLKKHGVMNSFTKQK